MFVRTSINFLDYDSSVFNNRKSPAASRMRLNSMQNACTSINRSYAIKNSNIPLYQVNLELVFISRTNIQHRNIDDFYNSETLTCTLMILFRINDWRKTHTSRTRRFCMYLSLMFCRQNKVDKLE